jgi:regulation of enolase protein 1 (concanavalin A-like superfamily)
VLFACAHAAAAQTTSLPAGWSDLDIGNPAAAGSAQSSNGTITVRGAGVGSGGSSDQFHFAFQQLAGDLDVRVRIESLDAVHPWAEAGLMIRESLADDAKHAFVRVRAGGGLAFEWRDTTGGNTPRINGDGLGVPIWVRLVRQGSEFAAYSSPTGTAWTLIGTGTVAMGSTVYVGLAVASHDSNQTATADFASLDVGSASQASASTPSSLPSPWKAADVGNPTLAGRATESGGTLTITGAGTDIWDSSDQFHFVYQPYTGDTDIAARVGSLQYADVWSKAGVMIRASLTGSAPHASMFATGAYGWAFQRRLMVGGPTYQTGGGTGTPPGWVRLVREGDLFTAYKSQDGSGWTLVGTDVISMPSTIYVGFAVTSHNQAATATATFSNVIVRTPVSSNQPPTVSIASPASGAVYVAPAGINVTATAGDVDGSVTRVDFYAGNQLVGSDPTNPFTVSWSNVAAGTYSLTAVATDNGGETATSFPVVVTVSAATSVSTTLLKFEPSPDHATNVTSYTVQLRRAGDATTSPPITSQNLGKPALVLGEITADISSIVNSLSAGSYYAVVVATGPGGSTPSSPSAAFTK